MSSAPPIPVSRWLRLWAVLTVCAAVAMLVLGSVVTTFRVGMADPVWPTYPWHLLLIHWSEPQPGFLIEHTHRLMGHVLGCCVIVLVVGVWSTASQPWLRRLGLVAVMAMVVTLALGFVLKTTLVWLVCLGTVSGVLLSFLGLALWRNEQSFWLCWLGTVALGGVILQGLLGGFRVQLNALMGTDLATLHGCFAQVIFALLVAVALLLSRGWNTPIAMEAVPSAGWLRRLSVGLVILIFGQLVLGAVVRHWNSVQAGRGHMLLAFGILGVVIWLAKLVLEQPGSNRLKLPMMLLVGLLVMQLLLGVEAWMIRFTPGATIEWRPGTIHQAFIRTSHVLMGSWILATAVVVALHVQRLPLLIIPRTVAMPVQPLEGAV